MVLFSELQTYLFPDNVCGFPFFPSSANRGDDDGGDGSDGGRNIEETLTMPQHTDTASIFEYSPRDGEETRTIKKRVRFAMDDATTVAKRKKRNLKQSIIQKSMEHYMKSGTATSSPLKFPSSSSPSPSHPYRKKSRLGRNSIRAAIVIEEIANG